MRTVASASWGKNIGNAIIDEAQKEPIVFEKIKYAFDNEDISFQLILGSSQILLLKKIRESLAGRVSIYEIWPLLMCEIYEHGNKTHHPLLDDILSSKDFDKLLAKTPNIVLDKEAAQMREAEEYLLK